MTFPVGTGRSHTDAAVKLIEDLASVTNSQILVGRGVQPGGSGWAGEPDDTEFRPYITIFPAPGFPDGSVAEPTEYLNYRVQATCVSATQEGAEAVADFAKTAWLNVPLDVPGRASYRGQLILDLPATRDDTISPPVHYAVLQVGWRTQAT